MAVPPPSNVKEKKANHSASGVQPLTHAEQSEGPATNVLPDISALRGIARQAATAGTAFGDAPFRAYTH
jgi:hypothetical protein